MPKHLVEQVKGRRKCNAALGHQINHTATIVELFDQLKPRSTVPSELSRLVLCPSKLSHRWLG